MPLFDPNSKLFDTNTIYFMAYQCKYFVVQLQEDNALLELYSMLRKKVSVTNFYCRNTVL